MRQPRSCRSTSSTSNDVHHRRRWPSYFAVETEDGHAVHGIVERRRLDHVVLLVAAQSVLRAERRSYLDIGKPGQDVERMRELCGHGGGMREHSDAFAVQGFAEHGLRAQAIDSKLHHSAPRGEGSVNVKPLA